MPAVLPVGLWVFSLMCDLLYLGGAEAELWPGLALYSMVAGFVCAFTAVALPGFVAQMNVTLVVLALYALNIWLRLGEEPAGLAIALSALGVGMLGMASGLEGVLIRLGGGNRSQ